MPYLSKLSNCSNVCCGIEPFLVSLILADLDVQLVVILYRDIGIRMIRIIGNRSSNIYNIINSQVVINLFKIGITT